MTPETLEALILDSEDALQVAHAFTGLDEKERAKLSTTAQKIYRQLYQSKADKSASPRLAALLTARGPNTWTYWSARETRNALLAMFAVGPVSAVKKRDIFVWQEHMPPLDIILRDRRPEWLDDWIAHMLDSESNRLDFAILRGWVRDGICRKPEVDGYYRMFAWYLMRTNIHDRKAPPVPPITVQLLADPGLLPDIDGLFRVENIAFNTNAWLTKGAGDDYETWTEALVKLSTAGHVDREHLLGLALAGLTLDLKQNQLSGFHGFYRKMAATPDEQSRHQQRYIDLLCHPVGHVVKFAIDMLGDLEKRDSLDTKPVLREVQTVFSSEGKGNATAALKLIARVLARSKGKDPEALGAICEALRHANADVQAQALDLLEKYVATLGDAQRNVLRSAEPFIAASNRPRVAKLLGSAASTDAPAVELVDEIPHYQPIAAEPNAHRVLDSAGSVEAIATVDALIEAVLHAAEVVDSPDEIERIIDAVSRLAGDRPFDFAARTAPLLHRLQNGQSSAGVTVGFAGVGLALLDLLHTWVTGRLHRTTRENAAYYTVEDSFAPLIAHLRVVTARVARRESQPLLCAPTHKGGWIDPLIWVDRLQALQAPGLAESMDFRLSLLRLAPDNRTEARGRLAGLPEPLRRIASFALGGDDAPDRADRSNHAAWITAARCRAPLADWTTAFVPLELSDAWPDSITPARYAWRAGQKVTEAHGQRWKHPELALSVTCDGAEVATGTGLFGRVRHVFGQRITTDWAALPSAALNRRVESARYWSGELHVLWVTQWLATIWPQNPAASHIKGVRQLAQRMDENSSNWSPSSGFFQALFQRGRPWGETGHLLLCIGLIGKDADARGLSVDALIEGIDARLFDPALFAATMVQLAQGEWVKFNRLGEALMLVVPVSPLHAAVVSDALQQCLPRLDLRQRNIFHLLEVMVEAQALTGQKLTSDARAALETFDGSGKAAKIAKHLQSFT